MDDIFVNGFEFWHWWVLGFALLALEVLTPGTFCMWIGFAAFATGIIAWVAPSLSWPAEIVLFALLSLVAVALWFRFKPMSRSGEVDNGLNQRGRSYIGRVLPLTDAIVNGLGKARLEDSVWRVAGPNLPIGALVRVIAAEGTTLRVEKAPEQFPEAFAEPLREKLN